MTEHEYEFRAGPGTSWTYCEPDAAEHLASLDGFDVRRRPVVEWEPYKPVAHL